MKTRAPSSPVVPSPAVVPSAPAAQPPVALKPTAPAEQFEPAADTRAPTSLRGDAAAPVEATFSPEERKALSKKIPCPALASMFNAGMLKTAKDGTVKIPDLEKALSQLGPDAATRKVLTNGADKTDDVAGSFNLFKLNGSNLDHTGSTGIRQNGVHPERFDLLMTFSKDGQTLTAKDLADAAEHFAKEDPGLRGRVTQLAEMSIVLNVFGRHAPDGHRYFTRDDAKQLFVDGQIPSSWSPPTTPGKVKITDVLGGAAMGFFRQLINGQ